MRRTSIRTWIGKMLSINSLKLILFFAGAVLVLLVVGGWLGRGSGFGRFVADLLNSGGLKEFLYNNNATSEKTNGWWSIVSLFIGTFLVSGVIIGMVTNILRSLGERYKNGLMDKYRFKGHILFLGYDDLMIGTLKKACEDTSSFVVIAVAAGVKDVRKKLNIYLPSRLVKNIEVVQCNRCDINDLEEKSRILYAKKIIIIGDPDEQNHDALNMKSLAEIAKKFGQSDKKTRILVYLKNQSTFALLQKLDLFAENLNALVNDEKKQYIKQEFLNKYCECFNFHSDMALRLLSKSDGLKPDWPSDEKNLAKCPEKQIHLVVMGMTQMGNSLVRESLLLAHPSGKGTRFRITMVDDNAYQEMHYFIGKIKELFKLCNYSYNNYDNPSKDFTYKPSYDILDIEFEFIQCDAAHPKLIENLATWANDENQMLTLAVCMKKSAQNIAFALYLPNNLLMGKNSIPIWVYQEEDDSMKQLLRSKNHPNIHTFSLSDHAVTDITTSKDFETAREIAKKYENKYGSSDTKWEELPVLYKWSSIHNVLSMEIKLRSIGIKNISEKVEIANEVTKKRIDRLEHDRWVVEKLSNGFVSTDSEQHKDITEELNHLKNEYKDWKADKTIQDIECKRKKFKKFKELQIHDDIRPFEDLDEYTQWKDRLFLDGYIESINGRLL